MNYKFYSEDLLDPSDDFVGRRVRRLIKVDDTVFEVFRERSTDRGRGHWNRGVMRSSNIQLVIILNKARTFSSKGQSAAW
jgi:hypothetical protein